MERDSQKGIIIGKQGKALKKVATEARRELERFFGKTTFILDCIPNPSPKEITDRTVDFVMTLRQKHPDTPIIVIQTLRCV